MSFSKEEAEEEQKERQEYVKNIGIEYRYGCYEENRPESCHVLGEYMEAIEQSFSKAYMLFKENCELRKFPKSCLKYATYRISGKECEASLKETIVPLEIACDANIAKGCRYLSLVHWNGEPDREHDSKKAERYMIKACELEDNEACWLLSTWYMGKNEKFAITKQGKKQDVSQDRLGSLEKNMEKALHYGKLACDLNIPQSCANVARMYKLGDGIPKDPDLASQYLEKAKAMLEIMKKGSGAPTYTG